MAAREIPAEVKTHPDYSDGYFSAVRGEPFDTNRAGSEPYAFGYEAGDRAVKLFQKHGFTRDDDSFSISLPVARP